MLFGNEFYSTEAFGNRLVYFLMFVGFIIIVRKLAKAASDNKKEIASGGFNLLKWWFNK